MTNHYLTPLLQSEDLLEKTKHKSWHFKLFICDRVHLKMRERERNVFHLHVAPPSDDCLSLPSPFTPDTGTRVGPGDGPPGVTARWRRFPGTFTVTRNKSISFPWAFCKNSCSHSYIVWAILHNLEYAGSFLQPKIAQHKSFGVLKCFFSNKQKPRPTNRVIFENIFWILTITTKWKIHTQNIIISKYNITILVLSND